MHADVVNLIIENTEFKNLYIMSTHNDDRGGNFIQSSYSKIAFQNNQIFNVTLKKPIYSH